MISQIFDRGSFKAIALFSLSPGSRFRRKEIKDRTGMHNVPLDNALSRLVTSGIIRKEKGIYSVNLDSQFAGQIIAIASSHHKYMRNLPLDVYFLLADIIYELSIVRGIEVWLFGSYSKMVYSDKSDIDIALIMHDDFSKDSIKKAFRKIEKHYGKKVEEHFFDAQSFYKNKRDPLVKEILRNGIRLM